MSKSKIIAVLAIIFILITLCVQVSATEGTEDNPLSLNGIWAGEETDSEANQIAANSIYANQVVANQVAANSVLQPAVNIASPDDDSDSDSLPQTGVTEDITVMFFIIVCSISAIYAYKKIKEYNV